MVWGEKTDEWATRIKQWHLWFAWRPVLLTDGRWVWLQRIERKLDVELMAVRSRVAPGAMSLLWDYRLPETK